MSEAEVSAAGPGRRPRWWSGPLRLIAGATLAVAVLAFSVLWLTGRTLPVPDWMVTEAQARINEALAGSATVRLGGIEAVVDRDLVPRLRLTDVSLRHPSGVELARVEELRGSFGMGALARGAIEPHLLRMRGVEVRLTRKADGTFDLPQAGPPGPERPTSFAEAFTAIDVAFGAPGLASLRRIEVEDFDFLLDDERSRQSWKVEGGRLTVDHNATSVAMGLAFELARPGLPPARAEIDFASRKDSPDARIEARVRDVSARDLAKQAPALAWLSVLDAPISGLIRSGIDEDGRLRPTAASLSIGAGALHPNASSATVPFESGAVEVTYDPATLGLALNSLEVESDALRLKARGKGWLDGFDQGLPQAVVAQIEIDDLRADPEGLFQTPVGISRGALDVKVTLNPFSARVGQFVLIDQGRRLSAGGTVAATPAGWDVALDFGVDAITSERLLALWPVRLVPKTREWLAANVATGELFDVKAALRLQPRSEGTLSLGYEFRDADVRFMRSLPPVRAGAGYATIHGNAYTLVLDKGEVVAPRGGPLDVAGSVMVVPDIRQKPALAELSLRTESSVTAALSILDEPPFGFLTKAGRPVDDVEGRARIDAKLAFPLRRGVQPNEVDFDVSGVLTGVTSDKLVPGRDIRAERLTVTATPRSLQIAGPGTLSGVPFDARWTQLFGPEHRGRSRVEANVDLSPDTLTTFGIALPAGSVGGSGEGRIGIDLVRGAAAAFTLTSELTGLSLAVPGLAWTKPRDRAGRIEVVGTLGTATAPPAISRLVLSAPGLDAEGSVSLRADGGLDRMALTSVAVEDWFDGSVEVRGRGRGSTPVVRITGGSADMRSARFGNGGPGGSVPLEIALDRLRISGGIELNAFAGTFSTGGGLTGEFTARVGGEAPISGSVVPMEARSAFRIRSGDAGAVFRASGVFTRGRGGELDLTLRPVGEPGRYRGSVNIKRIRVVDAPVLAELLGALSIVGLLQQLGGPGIEFDDVEGEFRLSPDAVEIVRGSAVGASLGVSAKGVYYSQSKEIDLAGTISPIYFVNVVGRPFTKQREGLFGFNYRLRGPAGAPQVSVNPLSILTPGMFREIFRAPPPKLNQ